MSRIALNPVAENPLKILLLAARPKTLVAALVPVSCATALCWNINGLLTWELSLFALLSAMMIQIATNYFNDLLDFKKGADAKEKRSGPRRFSGDGEGVRKLLTLAAFASLALAVVFSLPLIWRGGWVIVAIGIPSLYFSYGYTGGPFPLAYKGLGDLFVFIFFGLIATLGVCYLQNRTLIFPHIILAIQIGFYNVMLITINNLRDIDGDQKSSKKTLAVRIGESWTRRQILFMLIAAGSINFYWLQLFENIFAVQIPVLIIGIIIARKLFREKVNFNSLLALSALQLLVFAFGFCAGAFF